MTLIVTVTQLAVKLGLDPQRLQPQVKARMEDAITDAQEKVQGHLHRPLEATTRVIGALYPDTQFPLTDRRAWPQMVGYFDDRYRVESYVESTIEPDTYDVTFKVGLDAAGDPELGLIRRFVLIDAVETLTADPLFTAVKRSPTSVSAGGQSVSYAKPRGQEVPGAPVTLKSLDRWKRIPVSQAPTLSREPWPYDTGYLGVNYTGSASWQ